MKHLNSVVAASFGALFALAAVAGPARADAPPSLAWPAGCAIGENCWIVHYVDHDPTDGVRDYMCGAATYNLPPDNRHQGTDIAIRDEAAMRAGVAVRAAAPGVVVGARDGMDDKAIEESEIESIAGRECGNGVRIDHGGGWASQYCHLRKGSITVAANERVEAGQVLGLIGLSGLSSFPHLHFQVSQGQTIIDPFVGVDRNDGACGLGEAPLWAATVLDNLIYQPTTLHAVGFAGEPPDATAARQGHYAATEMSRYLPALVVWAEAFNVEAGDRVHFRILAPDGDDVLSQQSAITRKLDRWFGYSGRERPDGGAWPPGTYRAEVRLIRKAAGADRSLDLGTTSEVTLK